MDDDGLLTITYIVIVLKQNNNYENIPLFEPITIKALERLKICSTRKDGSHQTIDDIINIINNCDESLGKKLVVLENFVLTNKATYRYLVQDIQKKTLTYRNLAHLVSMGLKPDLPSTLITFKKLLNADVYSKTKSSALYEEVTIERSLDASIDNDISAIAQKFYSADGKEQFTFGRQNMIRFIFHFKRSEKLSQFFKISMV